MANIFEKLWNAIPVLFNANKSTRGEIDTQTNTARRYGTDAGESVSGGHLKTTDDSYWVEHVLRVKDGIWKFGFNTYKSFPKRFLIEQIQITWKEFVPNATNRNFVFIGKISKDPPYNGTWNTLAFASVYDFYNYPYTSSSGIIFGSPVINENETLSFYFLDGALRPLHWFYTGTDGSEKVIVRMKIRPLT